MKRLSGKREKIIAIVGMLLAIGAAFYILALHQTLQSKDRLIESIKREEIDANKTASYIETICAEYRKLYQSYREARYPDPASVDKYIGLPGSAKGQIDECYLPD